MKLELKHIAPYLPYELRLSHIESGSVHTMLRVDIFGGVNALNLKIIGEDAILKPLLRPISSITEEEALELLKCAMPCSEQDVSKGSYSLAKDGSDLSFTTKDYCLCDYVVFIDNGTLGVECEYKTGGLSNHYPDMVAYEWLFKNHFDVFGLIDRGLAIDKTKLK